MQAAVGAQVNRKALDGEVTVPKIYIDLNRLPELQNFPLERRRSELRRAVFSAFLDPKTAAAAVAVLAWLNIAVRAVPYWFYVPAGLALTLVLTQLHARATRKRLALRSIAV